jgi:hypothetical protein
MTSIISAEHVQIFCRRLLYARGHGREWGRHIRSSPHQDPELLQKLNQFLPQWDVFSQCQHSLEPVKFYDVVKWLNVRYHTLEANSHTFVDISQPSTRLG